MALEREGSEGRINCFLSVFLLSCLPLAAHTAVCLAGASPAAGIGCLPA